MKITAPVKGYTGKRAGVHFSDGVAHTDDPAAIAYFRRHAYTVEEDEGDEKPAKSKGKGKAADVDLSELRTPDQLRELTVPHLNTYAVQHEVDLGDAKRKDDVIAALIDAGAYIGAPENPPADDGKGDTEPAGDGDES